MKCQPERSEGPRGFLHNRKILRFTFSLGFLLFYSFFKPGLIRLDASVVFARNVADQSVPGVKPGSIDDVNAIGRRKIGGRGLGNWYSTGTETDWGNQIAARVLKSAKIIHDPAVNEYVNRIGQKIADDSDAKIPFTVYVIDAHDINAFALPGGYLFINSGLILAADNEAQLAAVMAHEIAHVAAHHEAREMTRMHYADAGVVPLLASSVAIPLPFTKFQQDFEEQADWLGVQYMYKAGYDPQQMIAFFERIEALQKTRPGSTSKIFSTHPQTPARVKRTQHEIATILPLRSNYTVDTPEFHAIQTRIQRLEDPKQASHQ